MEQSNNRTSRHPTHTQAKLWYILDKGNNALLTKNKLTAAAVMVDIEEEEEPHTSTRTSKTSAKTITTSTIALNKNASPQDILNVEPFFVFCA